MNFICGRAAVNSPPFSKGDVCVSRQRDSDGFSHWQFKVPCAVNPLPSLSPVGSSLLGREPTSVSFAIFRCRVFRVPSAAEPLTTVPLFQRGMSASADRGILMGSSHWQFKVPCAVNPLPSLSPVGSSLLGREPAVESFARYGTESLGFRGTSILFTQFSILFEGPVIVIFQGDLLQWSLVRRCPASSS